MLKENLDTTQPLAWLPRVYSFINLMLYIKSSIKKKKPPMLPWTLSWSGVYREIEGQSYRHSRDTKEKPATAAPRTATAWTPTHSLNTSAQAHGYVEASCSLAEVPGDPQDSRNCSDTKSKSRKAACWRAVRELWETGGVRVGGRLVNSPSK